MTDTTYWPPQSRNSPNPDFNPPPTTGSNAIPPAAKGSAIRKCPFRKSYQIIYSDPQENNFFDIKCMDCIIEEFQDCIGKECALWTPLGCKG